MNQVVFRYMTPEDIDRVLEIEFQSFTLPWSRAAFETELTKNHFSKYVVLILEGTIVGYGGMWMIVDEAHVTNIAIDPQVRGKHLGEALLQRMMVLAISLGAQRMTLEVRVSNKVAQRLYEKMGFTSYGVRKRYYTDNNEDALIMWATLQSRGTDSEGLG